MFRFTDAVMQQQTEQMMRTAFAARAVNELADLKKEIREAASLRHHVIGHIAGFSALVLIAAVVGFIIAHEPSLREIVGWIFAPR
jgi:hypothetical protein